MTMINHPYSGSAGYIYANDYIEESTTQSASPRYYGLPQYYIPPRDTTSPISHLRRPFSPSETISYSVIDPSEVLSMRTNDRRSLIMHNRPPSFIAPIPAKMGVWWKFERRIQKVWSHLRELLCVHLFCPMFHRNSRSRLCCNLYDLISL
ncbi:hypothetical protein BDN72DRAFT_441983 [Pluteus cervinus]|uniref:Uncharacterized protein n=1 Tax=Pluteus cervinus TaxID=181527 RepID=A0ACD3BB04_9AGAR|nr:hypothetical protein BDN72DRAFT_441983 [Pluteus cervinus]